MFSYYTCVKDCFFFHNLNYSKISVNLFRKTSLLYRHRTAKILKKSFYRDLVIKIYVFFLIYLFRLDNINCT